MILLFSSLNRVFYDLSFFIVETLLFISKIIFFFKQWCFVIDMIILGLEFINFLIIEFLEILIAIAVKRRFRIILRLLSIFFNLLYLIIFYLKYAILIKLLLFHSKVLFFVVLAIIFEIFIIIFFSIFIKYRNFIMIIGLS